MTNDLTHTYRSAHRSLKKVSRSFSKKYFQNAFFAQTKFSENFKIKSFIKKHKMSQRRLLPFFGAAAMHKIRSQQRSDFVHAKSADVVKFEDITTQNDLPSKKSG